MSLLANIRQRKKPWARRVVGAFVVAWFSMVLQPCVMADDHQGDCPNCPPHDMATMDMPCATGTDCSVLDDLYYDGRTAQAKVQDLQGGDLYAVVVPWQSDLPANALYARSRATRLAVLHPGSSPPRHKLFCVYLN